MKKGVVFAIVLVLIVLLAVAVFYVVKSASSQGQGTIPLATPISVTRENLPAFLQNQQIVKSLPSNGVMSLRFYNFSSGQRIWEESYTITKGNVQLGQAQNPDIEITIDSKYITDLGTFCATIENAKRNGDMGTELKISQTSFLWKYRGMMSYKSCLGF